MNSLIIETVLPQFKRELYLLISKKEQSVFPRLSLFKVTLSPQIPLTIVDLLMIAFILD
ncbi:hypothetical protein [Bartonella phoceensis]|uniref:hypothetical protein n=1 Tax=Bartonella phoceensis TaxID=270249 RepID=UPI001ABAD6A4|nr:hypothetical protein [Bartonella phoceensis]